MKKPTIEFIRAKFEKEGYELLTTEYINCKQKLQFICPRGHKHSIPWYHWQEGVRCLKCVPIENSNRFRLDFNIVKDSFAKSGYILLTDKYINAHQQLEYICPAGHRHSMTWNNWSKGHRCVNCAWSGENNPNYGKYGELSPNWRGGISCEPYCDVWADKEFKEDIKARDNYECQNPDCWGTGGRLAVHHIDYNKKNCRPENLITLCNSCNSRANYNRERHKEFYRNIMEKGLTK